MSQINCVFCDCPDHPAPAVRWMPQSIDQGKTVKFVPACHGHADGWWDGADWNGEAMERRIEGQRFYVWANEDTVDIEDDLRKACETAKECLAEGCEDVHIVDADGVEVVDARELR